MIKKWLAVLLVVCMVATANAISFADESKTGSQQENQITSTPSPDPEVLGEEEPTIEPTATPTEELKLSLFGGEPAPRKTFINGDKEYDTLTEAISAANPYDWISLNGTFTVAETTTMGTKDQSVTLVVEDDSTITLSAKLDAQSNNTSIFFKNCTIAGLEATNFTPNAFYSWDMKDKVWVRAAYAAINEGKDTLYLYLNENNYVDEKDLAEFFKTTDGVTIASAEYQAEYNRIKVEITNPTKGAFIYFKEPSYSALGRFKCDSNETDFWWNAEDTSKDYEVNIFTGPTSHEQKFYPNLQAAFTAINTITADNAFVELLIRGNVEIDAVYTLTRKNVNIKFEDSVLFKDGGKIIGFSDTGIGFNRNVEGEDGFSWNYLSVSNAVGKPSTTTSYFWTANGWQQSFFDRYVDQSGTFVIKPWKVLEINDEAAADLTSYFNDKVTSATYDKEENQILIDFSGMEDGDLLIFNIIELFGDVTHPTIVLEYNEGNFREPDGGIFGVKNNSGNFVGYYKSLNEAFAAATSGQTVEVPGDWVEITDGGILNIGDGVNFNLQRADIDLVIGTQYGLQFGSVVGDGFEQLGNFRAIGGEITTKPEPNTFYAWRVDRWLWEEPPFNAITPDKDSKTLTLDIFAPIKPNLGAYTKTEDGGIDLAKIKDEGGEWVWFDPGSRGNKDLKLNSAIYYPNTKKLIFTFDKAPLYNEDDTFFINIYLEALIDITGLTEPEIEDFTNISVRSHFYATGDRVVNGNVYDQAIHTELPEWEPYFYLTDMTKKLNKSHIVWCDPCNGRFYPGEIMTLDSATHWIHDLLDLPIELDTTNTTDIEANGYYDPYNDKDWTETDWFKRVAATKGYFLHGVPKQCDNPDPQHHEEGLGHMVVLEINRDMTRADVAYMFAKLLRFNLDDPNIEFSKSSYKDLDKVSEITSDTNEQLKAKRAIYICEKYGFMSGYGNKNFDPTRKVTRVELALVMNRIIDFGGGYETKFNGINPMQWYFYELMACDSVGLYENRGQAMWAQINEEDYNKLVDKGNEK